MRSSSRFPIAVFARVAAVVLLSTSGCADTGPEAAGFEAALEGPPAPVAPFLNGAFPSQTPNDLSSSSWDIVEAFPGVSFNQTLVIVTNPEPGNNRLYVGSRDGNIFSMANDPSTTVAEPFMDIRDRVAAVWDGGFLGLAFHPEFGTPGSPYETTFYTYYSSYCPTTFDGQEYVNDLPNCNPGYPQSSTGGFFNTWLRASEFQAVYDAGAGVWRGDASSEKPLFNIRLYNGSHRGGGPVFGEDGYMYIIIGDQFRYETAQNIVTNFEGGSVRLAVDVTDNGDGTWTCPPGSHQPVRRLRDVTGNSDEITGQFYCIPDDNPWVSLAGDNFGEFYSIGHRNPHRISVDQLNGRIWSGEVGQNTREEINVILPGRNYQWPYREGLTGGVRPKPATIIGTEQPPVIDFIRSEARTIIGGYVYRGTEFPELYGKYIAGDYSTNNVWAITLNDVTMTATKDLLTVFAPGALSTFGQDKAGEVYLGDVLGDDALYGFSRVGTPTPEPPSTLSALGAFTNTANFELSPYWVPYELNMPFWSDGAEKFRWIALPNDGTRDDPNEQVAYSATGNWGYPNGTVLMKHFELVLDENDPGNRVRLETRFLVLGDDDVWYGVTYRWRADQTEADLLTTFETADYTIALADGGTRDQTWYFPSRDECLSCHLEASGDALGLSARQQNGDMYYPSSDLTGNQLVTWNQLGMLSPEFDESALPTLLRSVHFDDVTAPLGDRARSWLDSNCGYCHRPGGANAGFDARLTTPFENQGLVLGGVRDDLGLPGMTILTPGDPDLSAIYQRAGAVGPIAMPPLAKALAQTPAVEILGEWILRVEPNLGQNGVTYEYYETGSLNALPDFGSLVPNETGTVNDFDIGVRSRDDNFAFRFTSLLNVGTSGSYTFSTFSDDGSQLWIDGTLVVDNDGVHSVQQESGSITLSAGYHTIEVTFFERTGGQSLAVEWQGPDTGGSPEPIGAGKLFLQQPSLDNLPPDLTDPGPQQSPAGAYASLSLSATDPDGDFLYFDASGLPRGLTVDHTTGEISGNTTDGGSFDVTVSASDASEVAVVGFTWTVTGPFCGDGTVDAGEECDDGNSVNGDGCSASCVVEFCGDGIVQAPEQCDDGNNVDGDGCSMACQIETAGQELTGLGAIIARVTAPLGQGSRDLEIIRDGDLPMQGSFDKSRQYDTWDGVNQASEEWIGYTFASDQIFGRVLFQEGLEFFDGGYFETLTVQVRQSGVWNEVTGLVTVPTYAGANGTTFEIYEMTFNPVIGDGIRIYGAPGGSADFVSIAELQVFAPSVMTVCGDGVTEGAEQCDDGNTVPDDGCNGVCQLEFCGDGLVQSSEECDDGNTVDGDGCDSACTLEPLPVCGDGTVEGAEECDDGNTVDGDGCDSSCSLEPVCGDGVIEGGEQCDDGNTVDGDGCDANCQAEASGQDLTDLGTIVARVTAPQGQGNRDLEVIRDNDFPPTGSFDKSRQYDTWDGVNAASEEWIGYVFASDQIFGKVVFQEGMHFFDGGFYDTLSVQVRQSGVWNDVVGLSVVPTYAGSNGVNFETFEMTFVPAIGDGIRIHGDPGGSADFISVAELEVYAAANPTVCGDGVLEGAEQCDDGNTVSDDGCNDACRLEFCGDNTVQSSEECDDGNNTDGDGCDASCNLEPVPDCGDGTVQAPEECDDGNNVDGDGCDSGCRIEPFCGDGTVDAGEQCDDGNNVDGDGCDATCGLEPFCGDGTVQGPEACDDGNNANGDGCDANCQFEPVCGDGSLDPGEQCDDGNTIGGDGCSSTCTTETVGADLTDAGSIIARVLSPQGGGNLDPEVIRDDDRPAPSCFDSSRQYDTWDGGNTASEDWIGYEYSSDQLFGKVVFQEGREFYDGGFFETLTVQVRQGGVWNDVSGLSIVPSYGSNNGIGCEVFEMTFNPTVGDAIRIYGQPGGVADFISVAELDVFAPGIVTCGNGSVDAGEQCDDGNTAGNDGCGPTCQTEFCGDGIVNNGTEACEPPGTASCELDCTPRAPLCGDGYITAPETCEDGNTDSGDGCSSDCAIEDNDLTQIGTIVAAVINPLGQGSKDLEVIRDGDFPPVGSFDSSRQYDTWDGANVATEDWVGYVFAAEFSFERVVFQEGREFYDGGWFDTLTVQVRQGGAWLDVTNLVVNPVYPANNGDSFETFELLFDATTGDGIRIQGAPGGASAFISVAELEVFGTAP